MGYENNFNKVICTVNKCGSKCTNQKSEELVLCFEQKSAHGIQWDEVTNSI